MPKIVPQEMKAISTIKLQPDKMSEKYKIMTLLDIGGATGNQIGDAVKLCASRVSIIRNSPLYRTQLEIQREELTKQVLEKQSDRIASGDPVENKLKALALNAVDKYEFLLDEAQSEVVQKDVASSILDRAGYKAFTEKTKVSVEVTEKMADRFETVLGYRVRSEDEPSKNVRTTTLRVEKEVS